MATDQTLKLDGLQVAISPEIKRITEILTDSRKLSDPTVGPSVYSKEHSLKGDHTETLGGFKLTVGASATGKFALDVYNDDSDKDPDKIARPSAGKVCLKSELSASGRLTGFAKLPAVQTTTPSPAAAQGGVDFGIDFSAEGNLRLLQYRAYGPNEKLGAAVGKLVKSYRFPFRASDIEKLAADEVLAYIAHGKLGFKAELSWSDVISATVSALDDLLGQTGIATFNVNLGAKAAFSLAASDDYRFEFRRNQDTGFVQLDLRKNEQNRIGTEIGFSAGAGFADPKDLAKSINTYLKGRLGIDDVLSSLEKINEQVKSFEELDDVQKEIVEELVDLIFDLDIKDDVIAKWEDFQKKLKDFIATLEKRVTEAVSKRVELDFAFSYSRVKTDSTLLSCEIDPAHLPDLLTDLLVGRLTGLVTELGKSDAQTNGYILKNYLDTKKVETTKSFGFSLSLGKWRALGKNTATTSWTEATNIREEKRLSYQSQSRYVGSWGPESFEYVFELPSAMQNFSAAPRVADFETSWNMAWYWTGKKLKAQTVCNAVDLANLWGILREEDMTEAFAEVWAKAKMKNARLEVEMKVDHEGITTLLQVDRSDFYNGWVKGLAAALPPVTLDKKGGAINLGLRGGVADRIAAYEPAARLAFNAGQAGHGVDITAVAGAIDYPSAATPVLRAIDLGSRAISSLPLAAVVEARLTWSLRELWQTDSTSSPNRPFQLACRFYDSALGPLRNGTLNKDAIQTAFQTSQKLVEAKPYNSRLTGYVVSSLLRSRAVHIDTTFKVVIQGDGDEDKEVIVLG